MSRKQTTLDKVVWEGPPAEVTFEQKPESGKAGDLSSLGRGNSDHRAPRQEEAQHSQGRAGVPMWFEVGRGK